MQGRIEAIDDTKSDKFKTVTISGEKYGAPAELVNGLETGMTVDFEFVKQNQFKNIIKIAESGTSQTAQSKSSIPLDQIMGDTLIAVNQMFETLPLNSDFKQAVDWSDIVCSLFISKRGRS